MAEWEGDGTGDASRTSNTANDGGKCAKLDEVITTFRRWMHLPDIAPLEVVLGAVAANLMRGDPLWLMVVGPSSGGKSELLQSICLLECVHPAATMTEASLLSGTAKQKMVEGAKGGLLNVTGSFGIILCKDFTSILSMGRDARSRLLAALREIYDGSWTRHLGVDGGKTLSWSGKLGLIAGCTPSIDSHHSVIATMGQRFVMYRFPPIDAAQQARSALDHVWDEQEMRKELSEAVLKLFADWKRPQQSRKSDAAGEERLIALASLAVRCRSPVERHSYKRDIELIPEAEAPARMVKQLKQLKAGMEAIGVPPEESWRNIQKVAFDCMPSLRLAVFKLLTAAEQPLETAQITQAVGYLKATQTTRRALEDLEAHEVLVRQLHGKSDVWQLSDWARKQYKLCGDPIAK